MQHSQYHMPVTWLCKDLSYCTGSWLYICQRRKGWFESAMVSTKSHLFQKQGSFARLA